MGFENISVNWFKYSEAHMESPTTCAPPLQVLGGELLGYVRIPQPFS